MTDITGLFGVYDAHGGPLGQLRYVVGPNALVDLRR